MNGVMKFKNIAVTRQIGEVARLKVVQGPDQGTVYVLTITTASLGRGEMNDVILGDLKMSRQHAQIAKTPAGWQASDAGSANGILVNGRAVKTAMLKPGDQIGLGETILEFVPAEAATSFLQAPPKNPAEMRAVQLVEDFQRKKVHAAASLGGIGNLASKMNRSAGRALPRMSAVGSGSQSKLILGVAAVAIAVLVFVDGDPKKSEKPEETPKAQDATAAADRNLASYLPAEGAHGSVRRSAEQFYRAGFREYKHGNYLRAKQNFETALQIDPGYGVAKLYLTNCEKSLEDEVTKLISSARKDKDIGKLRSARGKIESAIRLLEYRKEKPAYLEAQDQLKEIDTLERKDQS